MSNCVMCGEPTEDPEVPYCSGPCAKADSIAHNPPPELKRR